MSEKQEDREVFALTLRSRRAPACALSRPFPSFHSDVFSNRTQHAQTGEVPWLERSFAQGHQSADRRWRGVENRDAMLCNHLPAKQTNGDASHE